MDLEHPRNHPVTILVRKYRDEHNLSKQEMATLAGITLGTIKNVESGHRISANTVCLLAKNVSDEFTQFIPYNTCIICGEKFIPNKPSKKTCSKECMDIQRRNNQNALYHEMSKQKLIEKQKQEILVAQKEYQNQKKQKIKAERFEQFARDAGLTYGQRQAMERLGLLTNETYMTI